MSRLVTSEPQLIQALSVSDAIEWDKDLRKIVISSTRAVFELELSGSARVDLMDMSAKNSSCLPRMET